MSDRDMRIVLGGVRGSMPISHPAFVRFGGATTSVLVDDGAGGRVVLDAGTGLRTLEPLLATPVPDQPVLLLFTHYHLDHVMGLPSFAPLYNPAWSVVIASPPRGGITAEQAVRRLTEAPFWPAPFLAKRLFLVLTETCDKPFRHGPFDIRWCAVHHANGCHAYRIDERETGAAMAFATDFEWSESSDQERLDLIRLCTIPRPVDVLLMEGHDDTEGVSGWGHSTWQQAVQFAHQVKVKQVVITHLAPDDDDEKLTERGNRIRATWPQACLGRQGMSIAWRKG